MEIINRVLELSDKDFDKSVYDELFDMLNE